MGDIQRTIAAKLRVSAEGDAQVFGKTADEIEKMQEASKDANSAADALGKTFERATNAVASGSVRAAQDVVKAKVAVEAYRSAIEEAEKAGVHIGEGAREGLADLEKKLAKATESAGKLEAAEQHAARATKDATEAAGGQAERINSLDDIVNKLAEDLGPGAVKWLSWGAAAVGAFTAGWEAGKKLLGVLDELTDGQVSRNIQEGFIRQLAQLGITFDQTTSDAQALRNELHVLASRGIDTAGKSAAEVHAIFVKFSNGLRDTADEASKGVAKIKAFVEALPTKAEAQAAADALGTAITKFQAINQLPIPKLKELFGAEIKGVLEELDRLGVEAPAHLKGWVDALNILPSSLDKIKGEVETRIDALAKAFGAKDAQVALEQQVKEFNAAIERVLKSGGKLNEEEAKKTAQALVDAWRVARGQLSPEIEAIADRFHIATAAMERTDREAIVLGKTLGSALPGDFRALQGGLNDTAAVVTKTGETLKGLDGDLKAPARGFVDLGVVAATKAAPALKEAGDKARDAAPEIAKPGLAAATSKEALQAIADDMKKIGDNAPAAATGAGKVGTALGEVATPAQAAKKALQEIGTVDIAGPISNQVSVIKVALDGLAQQALTVLNAIRQALSPDEHTEGPV